MTCFSIQNFLKGLSPGAWLINILLGIHVDYITGCSLVNALLAENQLLSQVVPYVSSGGKYQSNLTDIANLTLHLGNPVMWSMRGGQLAGQFDFFRYSVNLVTAKSSSQKTECLILCKEIYREIFIHRVFANRFYPHIWGNTCCKVG